MNMQAGPSIDVDFCGIRLRNPTVIAASPATETAEGILKCGMAGAGAVVTKSIADFDDPPSPAGMRRVYQGEQGYYAMSTYYRETLTRSEGLSMIKKAYLHSSVPIIASVTAQDTEISHWLPICKDVQNAGASIIQLDLYYLVQPICQAKNWESLLELLKVLKKRLSIPVMVKLNVEIPAYAAAYDFPPTGIDAICLLDSVRVPSPIDINARGRCRYEFVNQPGMSSLFGTWQLPITQHYAMILARLTDRDLCVGGGVDTAHQAIELIMLGANTISFASAMLIHGYGFITGLINELRNLLDELGFDSIDELRGLALGQQVTDMEKPRPDFEPARAVIDLDACSDCLRCSYLTFCSALTSQEGRPHIEASACDGCGFCVPFCERKAIHIHAVADSWGH